VSVLLNPFRFASAPASSAAWVTGRHATYSDFQSGGGTHIITLGSNCADNNVMVCGITVPIALSVSSVLDNAGNAPTATINFPDVGGGGIENMHFYVWADRQSQAAHIILSGATTLVGGIHEATGIHLTNPFDGSGGQASNGFSGPHSVSFTTTVASGLALSRWIFGATMTIPSGWTATSTAAGNAAVYSDTSSTLGSAGAKTLTLTNAGGSTRAAIVALRAS
jgi:hypothetical protein